MSDENKVFVELWQRYKKSIESAQDDLKLELYDDIVDLIASFTTWKQIKMGQFVDVQDLFTKWYVSIIINVGYSRETICAYIGYCNWPRGWSEWIPIDSDRIQPLGTHTRGIPYLGYFTGFIHKYIDLKDFKLSCGSMVSYDEDFGIVIKYRHPKVHVRFYYCDRWVNIDELKFDDIPSKEWYCVCGRLNKDIYYEVFTDNFPGICGKCGEMFSYLSHSSSIQNTAVGVNYSDLEEID